MVVPAAAGGQVFGGLIPRLLKLRVRGLITQSLVASLVGVVSVTAFLNRCETARIAGVTVPYFNRYL